MVTPSPGQRTHPITSHNCTEDLLNSMDSGKQKKLSTFDFCLEPKLRFSYLTGTPNQFTKLVRGFYDKGM